MDLVIVEAAEQLCGLPIEHVDEIMRPLPCERLGELPAFVLGVSIIRGTPTPVIDLGLLISARATTVTRLMTLKLGARRAAITLSVVRGVRRVAASAVAELPPLLRAGAELITALGALDERLLVVLSAARLVPAAAWSALANLTAEQ